MTGSVAAIIMGILVMIYGFAVYANPWNITGKWFNVVNSFWKGRYRLPFSREPTSLDDFRRFAIFFGFIFGIFLIVLGGWGVVHGLIKSR